MDIVIYGYSDNLDKNYVSPPLSLYPLCTVVCAVVHGNNQSEYGIVFIINM